jgi:hypothetical protein
MSETFAIVGFALLMAMVATWFVLISWLFSRLRERHASTYEAMGSPTLFWNYSNRNNWLFMKFLFSSEWRGLNDPAVANVCRFMRIFIIAFYFLFFVGFAAFIFHDGPKKRVGELHGQHWYIAYRPWQTRIEAVDVPIPTLPANHLDRHLRYRVCAADRVVDTELLGRRHYLLSI